MIKEAFVKEIIFADFGDKAEAIYSASPLFQYLDMKMKAVHGDSKTRRSLANIYAIYSILKFYVDDYYGDRQSYCSFDGYDYMRLFNFYRSMYGGRKLQNHALNSRVNGEFKNKIEGANNDLIIVNDGKYLLHVDYLYVGNTDISKTVCKIIEKYVDLLIEKDHSLITNLNMIKCLDDYGEKKRQIKDLLNEDSEARVFEIISYAILKNHFSGIKVYFGYTRDKIKEEHLRLYKTGRTNANDGGIDFVMRPIGRFFQVTEVDNYDKYLLDIDKVMHFPVTFVIKTSKSCEYIKECLARYIEERAHGMDVIRRRYNEAIEEIITINELVGWINKLSNKDIDGIIRDIDIYYRLEMNMDVDN